MVPPAVDPLIDPAGPGTDEDRWRAAIEGRALPAVGLARLGPPGRVVVVAPHPDDEVLGAGGLIRHLAGARWTVDVLAVTDGEAAFGPADRALADQRVGEVAVALQRLCRGVSPRYHPAVERLGLPDGGVAAHAAGLESALVEWLTGARLCVAPWPGDGHPDHEAAGRATERVAAGLGVTVLEYPVWLWHWGDPERDLPWRRCRRLDLDALDLRAKRRALSSFASQSRPSAAGGAILTDAVLAHFRRATEVFVA